MQNRIIEWYQDDQFASANLNRVDLFEIKGKRSLLLKSTFELPSQVSCISCNAARGVVAAGQQSGNISFLHGETTSGAVVYDSGAARRACTAISWNKQNCSQLAAGFEKSRSQGEFCAVVWDIEGGSHPTDKVLFRPTSEEPTASICWLDAHVLVVGTSISWVRLYDVRVSGGQQGSEIMSIMAHAATRPRKVKGIRCDSLQQHIVATFSDSPGEPIKIWDLRKAGVTAKPKLMIVQSHVAAVVDVAWSSARAGVLAVATNQSRHVNFYSTVKPVTELVSRTPFHTITVADPVKSLTWKIGSVPSATSLIPGNSVHGSGENKSTNINVNMNMNISSSMNNNLNINMSNIGSSNSISESKDRDYLRSNRLLVATTSGFADLDVIESVGLGLGAGGCVAVGCGRHVNIIRPSKSDSKSSENTSKSTRNMGAEAIGGVDQSNNMIGNMSGLFSDIEILMGSRCSKGYSIDAGRNLQVLSDELDSIESAREREQINGTTRIVDTQTPTNQLNNIEKASNMVPASSIQKSSSSNDLLDSMTSRDTMDPGSADSTSPQGQDMPSMQTQVLSLTRLWAWVDRVESLGNEGLSVTSCGVINLLSSSPNSTHSSVHAQLGVSVYSSESRDLAKELCGWTKMPSVSVSDAAVAVTAALQSSQLTEKVKSVDKIKNKITTASSETSKGSLGGSKSHSVEGDNDQEASTESVMQKGKRDKKSVASRSTSSVEFEVRTELEEMVAECEEGDSFGRAASIALFHGDLTLAVCVLQKHIPGSLTGHTVRSAPSPSIREATGVNDAYDDESEEGQGDAAESAVLTMTMTENTPPACLELDPEFAQLISLTAMCIAGYSNSNNNSNTNSNANSGGGGMGGHGSVSPLTPQQVMWVSMCRHVVAQLEAQSVKQLSKSHSSSSSSSSSSCCYLASALRFLLDALHFAKREETAAKNGTVTGVGVGMGGKKEGNCAMKFGCIINDDRLSLEDRVSFACTYLDDHQTLQWLRGVRDDCTRGGDLGGLVVTGLAGEGVDLLQQYLDRHDDLQTVALLVGRSVIDNAVNEAARSVSSTSATRSTSQVRTKEWQWLWEYRNLLNKMELFIGRASLDVQLGRRNRMVRPCPIISGSSRTPPGVGPGMGPQGKLRQSQPVVGAGRGGIVDRKSGSARVLYQLPPHSELTHVFLRCNYCSSSLPADPLQQQQAAFFRKQKPLINCCANCKKPLPRCYVCLLYMSLVNPTHEFNRALVQRRKGADELALLSQSQGARTFSNTDTGTGTGIVGLGSGSGGTGQGQGHSEETPHNVLAFGQWFFFCQHCKHGGHAACIDDWFEGEGRDNRMSNGREVCGVNGCNCHCRSLK